MTVDDRSAVRARVRRTHLPFRPRKNTYVMPKNNTPIRFLPTVTLAVVASVLLAPLAQVIDAQVAGAAGYTFTTGTPSLDTITNGATAAPWNLFQGDPSSPNYASQAPGTVLPTYTPGGATTGSGASAEPNVAVYPGANSGTDGDSPYPSGTVGTPGPLDGYCGTGNQATESAGSPVRQPADTTLPLAPAYFPHVVRNPDGSLTGYFDYRPKDADEAIIVAQSTDNAQSWTYEGEALEQNPGYCPSADTNDDGQGHPNVITVGGTTRLYTLQRPAGDNPGIGMLVHTLAAPASSDPLSGVPATEHVGIDPDGFAASGAAVPATGGTPVPILVSETGAAGSPEQLVAGGFVDLTQNPVPTASTIINCSAVATGTLSGCTTTQPGGITVNSGDLIEQVIGYVKSAATVTAGPNTTTGDGGLASITVATTATPGTSGFTNATTGTLYNTNAPNRAYINGVAVYCNQANANPTTKMENCTTGADNPALAVAAGAPITSDPIFPSSASVTTGLVSPDGIVGVLPSYPGAPSGSTIVMYTEKELSYYVAGTTTNSSATNFSTGTITFTPSPYTSEDLPAVISPSSPVTVSMGDITASTIVPVTCTGLTTGATDSLTGCTSTAGVNDQYNATSLIGAPGAATVDNITLNKTGEGAGLNPSAKNIAKLMKNNEDLTILRVAYTTDGVDFSSAGLAGGGIISGNGTEGSNYNDINNPASTTSPGNINQYGSPGTADATEMRFVGSGGSIITNNDGSYGLFLSGAWAADGDSDAFNQIFYSSSTDGQHWSVPVSVISTDYTFAASVAQDSALASNEDQPLGISAYYSGRAYGPSVWQNPDGSLTMVFAGYRLPKPITSAGTVLGTGSTQYTVGSTDPALYRNILTVTLFATPNDAAAPEAPFAVLLPLIGLAIAGAVVFVRRRRRGPVPA
jgi:hypothetical protein